MSPKWNLSLLAAFLLSQSFAGTAQVELHGPSLTHQPPQVTYFSNTVGVTLTCSGSGPPPLATRWLSSTGEDLPQIPGIREQLQNGSLFFGPFKPEDYIASVHNGQYRCSVRNPVGTFLSSVFSVRAIMDHPFEVVIKPVSAVGTFTGGSGSTTSGELSLLSSSSSSSSTLLPYEWMEGSPALLSCDVQPSFYAKFVRVVGWKSIDQFGHEREISSDDSRYQLTSTGNLLIFSAKFQQLFVCIGQSILNSKIFSSQAYLLKTRTLGSIGSHSPRLIGIEKNVPQHSDATFTDLICLAVGSPSPSFRWEKYQNGKFVPITTTTSTSSSSSQRGSALSSSSSSNNPPNLSQVQIGPLLRLRRVNSESTSSLSSSSSTGNSHNHFINGTYRCEANNAFGSLSLNHTVIARTLPVVHLQPNRITAKQGQTVEFNCFLESAGESRPNHLDFVWFKNGRPLQRSGRVKVTLQKLLIFNAHLGDQGVYQCFLQLLSSASGESGGSIEEEKTVMLQASGMLLFEASAPELVHTFISQSLQPGPSLSLKCSAQGNPLPQISWSIDGQIVPDTFSSASSSASLPFSSPSPTDIFSQNRFWSEHHLRGGRFTIGGISHSNSAQWTQLGNTNGENVSYLNISGVHSEDSGFYKCTASNIVGLAEHSSRLNVFGAIFVKEMSPLTLVAGHTVNIPCYYGGFPVDKILWQKDSRNLIQENHSSGKRPGESEKNRFTIFANGTLQIGKISTEHDKGRYTCIVSNRKGEVASGHVDVNVMRPPVISTFKFDENLKEGQRTSISCNVISGDLPIDISWRKDGKELDSFLQQQLNITENKMRFLSVLIFDELRNQHSGQYTCSAENAAQQVKFAAKLEVKVSPKWIREPEDSKVILRGDHSLSCAATGVPQPTISWFRDIGGIKTPIGRRNSHVKISALVKADGSLELLDVGESDGGTYICEAVNGVGSGISRSIRLDVIIPAKVSAVLKSVIVAEGVGTLLQCVVRGDRPLQVIWKRNGVLVQDSTSKGGGTQQKLIQVNSSVSQAELRLGESRLVDSGEYQCIASNHYGRDQDTIVLEVKARPAPPENFLVEEIGSRFIRLRWSPPNPNQPQFPKIVPVTYFILQWRKSSPSLTWEYSGTFSHSTKIFNMTVQSPASHAVIELLNPVTNYDVRLMASNDIGQSVPTEPLSVLTLPEAPSGSPTNVSALPLTPKTVIVKWEPPDVNLQHGTILGYQVIAVLQAVTGSSGNNQTTVQDQKWDHQVELKELRPNSQYRISVRAYNSAGMGPESPYVFIQTPEGAPDSPPLKLQCEALSPKSLQVQWEPPPFHLSNGHILGYKVIYLPANLEKAGEKPEVKKTSNRETTLHGLRSFTGYSVKTLAYTVGGESETSDSVLCTTEEDVPDEPADIKALASSGTSALISWLPPLSSNGVVTKYTIHWKSDESDQVKEKQYVPLVGSGSSSSSNIDVAEQLFLEIRRLKEKVTYTFWVTASTSAGSGSASRSENLQIPASASKTPARIASFPVTKNAASESSVRLPCRVVGIPGVKVSWFKNQVPVLSQGLLRNGSLFISRVKDSDEGVYKCRAENDQGSDEIEHRIIISRPPSAVQIFIGYVTDTSMQIHWDPPEKADPSLTGYTLEYSVGSGSSSGSAEWKSLRLGPRFTSFSLENLLCGTIYRLRLFGENSVGRGEQSAVVKARTNGGSPEQSPRLTEILDGNGTMIRIDLNRWPDGGCPITNFHIEYRRDNHVGSGASPSSSSSSSSTAAASSSGSHWKRIRKENGTRVFIFGTEPNSRYAIRIQVENDAGSSTKLFHVESHPDFFTNYAKVLERVEVEERMNGGSSYVSFYTDPHVLVPIVSAVICTFAIAVCVLMLIRRKNQAKSSTEWKFAPSSSQHTWLSASDAGGKCGGGGGIGGVGGGGGCDSNSSKENMSIYATLNSTKPIPMTIRDSTVRLQSFVQHDNYDAPTHNILAAGGGKRVNGGVRRKLSNDDVCMQEVSCQMENVNVNFPHGKLEPPREFRSSHSVSSQLFSQPHHLQHHHHHSYPNSDSDDNDGVGGGERIRTPARELEKGDDLDGDDESVLYHDYSCPYQFTPAGNTGPPGELFQAKRREMMENATNKNHGAPRSGGGTLKKKRSNSTAKAKNRGPEYFD